jgi:muramidase (phage lysozyme)
MKPIADLRAALQHPNVQAWLRLIRSGESHDSDARAYMALYGWNVFGGDAGKVFVDFSDHPQVYATLADGRKTSAAGAYQIVYTTWKGLRQRRPGAYPDFSPTSQDLAAVDLTDGRGALDDVIAGRLEPAVEKCRNEWTSLPGAMETRSTMVQAWRTFRAWGGRAVDDPTPAAEQPAAPRMAPVEERTTFHNLPPIQTEEKPMAPFLAAALPALLQAVPSLLAVFGNKDASKSEKNAAALAKAVEIATQALNVPNAQAMAETLAVEPAARQKVAEAIEREWYTITALVEVGGGLEAARSAAADPNRPPPWRDPAMIVTLLLMPLVYFVVYRVVTGPDWGAEIRAAVVSAVVSGLLAGVMGYWLGTSWSSQKKTDVMIGGRQ